jgi:hypothetical protein
MLAKWTAEGLTVATKTEQIQAYYHACQIMKADVARRCSLCQSRLSEHNYSALADV